MSYQNKEPMSENGKTTQPNDAQSNNPEQILTEEQKSKTRKFKENHEQWKDYVTIIKKLRMENS